MHDAKIRKQIIINENEIRRLQSKNSNLRNELRESCNHESLVECDPQPETAIRNYQPAERACIECGLREDMWHKEKLTARPIRKVSRDEISEYYKLKPLKTVSVLEDE